MFSSSFTSSAQDPFVSTSSKPKMSALAPVFEPVSSRSTTNQQDPMSNRAAPGTVEYLQGIIEEEEMKNSSTFNSGKVDLLSIYGTSPGSTGPQQSTFNGARPSTTTMAPRAPLFTTPLRDTSRPFEIDVGYFSTPNDQIPQSHAMSGVRQYPSSGTMFQTPPPNGQSQYLSATLGTFTPSPLGAVPTSASAPHAPHWAMVPVPIAGLYASPFSPIQQYPSQTMYGLSSHLGNNTYTSPSENYRSINMHGSGTYGGAYNGTYNHSYHGNQYGYNGQHNRLANRYRKHNNSSPNHNIVEVDRIRAGLDVRTTVMLRNIPNKITQHQLLAIINESNFGSYDFVYLRIDFSNQCNVGYAFINFLDPLDIIRFVEARGGKKWHMFRSEKIAEVSYATIQGRDCLIQKFRNSSVMLEPEFCRPKLFFTRDDLLDRAGQEDPFPASDNASKLKRSCENAENVGLYAPTAGQALRDEQRRRRSQFDRGTTLAEQDELDEMMRDGWAISSPYQSQF